MKIKTKVRVEKEVTEMRMTVKCSDQFGATFHGPDGELLKDYDGYAPGFMPGQHDYVVLTIDLATGQIKNWRDPSSRTFVESLQWILDPEECDE